MGEGEALAMPASGSGVSFACSALSWMAMTSAGDRVGSGSRSAAKDGADSKGANSAQIHPSSLDRMAISILHPR